MHAISICMCIIKLYEFTERRSCWLIELFRVWLRIPSYVWLLTHWPILNSIAWSTQSMVYQSMVHVLPCIEPWHVLPLPGFINTLLMTYMYKFLSVCIYVVCLKNIVIIAVASSQDYIFWGPLHLACLRSLILMSDAKLVSALTLWMLRGRSHDTLALRTMFTKEPTNCLHTHVCVSVHASLFCSSDVVNCS